MVLTRPFVLPALLLILALPLTAQAHPLDAPKAPPAEPVYEVDPGDRPGYSRVVGHWEWTGDNYMWSPGRWVENRPGYVWVADSWSQRGKKWHLAPGHYEVDGDADDDAAAQAAEASESHRELPAHHTDTAAEEAKEHSEDAAAKTNEMDEVEQNVLSASAKPDKSAAKPGTHRSKQHVIKKPPTPNYDDPKLYPFYQHH